MHRVCAAAESDSVGRARDAEVAVESHAAEIDCAGAAEQKIAVDIDERRVFNKRNAFCEE